MTAATQFCHDFHLSPLALMESYGVPARMRPKVVQRLSDIYAIAQKNQEGSK